MQMRMKHIDTSAMYQIVTEEKKVDTMYLLFDLEYAKYTNELL